LPTEAHYSVTQRCTTGHPQCDPSNGSCTVSSVEQGNILRHCRREIVQSELSGTYINAGNVQIPVAARPSTPTKDFRWFEDKLYFWMHFSQANILCWTAARH